MSFAFVYGRLVRLVGDYGNETLSLVMKLMFSRISLKLILLKWDDKSKAINEIDIF